LPCPASGLCPHSFPTRRSSDLGHGEAEATELLVLSRKPFSGSWEYLLERPIFTFPPVNNWSGAALIDGDGRLVGIGSLIVNDARSEEHTSELQSRANLVCRLLL